MYASSSFPSFFWFYVDIVGHVGGNTYIYRRTSHTSIPMGNERECMKDTVSMDEMSKEKRSLLLLVTSILRLM